MTKQESPDEQALSDFEIWLRTVCFQKPTPEAYDLAKCAWKAGRAEWMAQQEPVARVIDIAQADFGDMRTRIVLALVDSLPIDMELYAAPVAAQQDPVAWISQTSLNWMKSIGEHSSSEVSGAKDAEQGRTIALYAAPPPSPASQVVPREPTAAMCRAADAFATETANKPKGFWWWGAIYKAMLAAVKEPKT